MPSATLADRLRAFRAAWRLTQEDLARELGLSWRTISRWEQGTQRPPSAELLDLALSELRKRLKRRARNVSEK